MKKILILLILVCSFAFCNGITFDYTQSSVITDYNTNNKGLSNEKFIVGSLNTYNIGNVTGDYKFELRGLIQPVYLLINNDYENTTFDITYINDNNIKINSSGTIGINQEFTMNEEGVYYFKITPSFEGESIDIMLNFTNSRVIQVFLQEEQPQGFNSLMGGFVYSFLDIIEINISLWRIFFYTVIIVIMIGFVLLLFGGSFWIFKSTQKIKEDRGFLGIKDDNN